MRNLVALGVGVALLLFSTTLIVVSSSPTDAGEEAQRHVLPPSFKKSTLVEVEYRDGRTAVFQVLEVHGEWVLLRSTLRQHGLVDRWKRPGMDGSSWSEYKK